MATPTPARVYTPADVEALDDPIGYELEDGHLVERQMGAESSEIGATIIAVLQRYLWGKKLGRVLTSEAALHIYPDRPNHFRRADVSFIRRDRLTGGKSPRGDLFLAPDLVVEVISPNDKAVEVEKKVREYLDAGVQLVWVVYPDTRSVMVYRHDGTSTPLANDAQLSGEQVIPGFACAVSEIFPED
jgi:Uma2 family endonuclease